MQRQMIPEMGQDGLLLGTPLPSVVQQLSNFASIMILTHMSLFIMRVVYLATHNAYNHRIHSGRQDKEADETTWHHLCLPVMLYR